MNYDTTGAEAIDLTSTALYKAAAPAGNPLTLPGAIGYDYKYLLVDKNKTLNYFAEYQWKATPDLNINAGAKYIRFTRDFNATVNQTSGRQALIASRTDSATTPSLTVQYQGGKTWSAYAEVARGFQAPSEANSFYVANANLPLINIKPQTSTNYQAGAVYKNDRFSADFDAYWIDFKNYAYSGPADSSGDPTYYGIARGAYYSGFEMEATYYLGSGISAYLNASTNNATFKGSKLDVPQVPSATSAFGFIYDQKSGFFASLTEKFVGSWTVYNTITNPDLAGGGTALSDSFWLGDLSVGYGRRLDHGFLHNFKVRLQVSNLFNQKVQSLDTIGATAASAYTTDAFNVLPERSYFLTFSAEF